MNYLNQSEFRESAKCRKNLYFQENSRFYTCFVKDVKSRLSIGNDFLEGATWEL